MARLRPVGAISACLVASTLTGCGANTEERAATGAMRGAVTGAVVGGPVGALVGAAVGGATDPVIGSVLSGKGAAAEPGQPAPPPRP